MGLLTTYFAARSDRQAAATIDTGPPRGSDSAPVEGNGIEPVVHLATLEHAMTGRPVDDCIDDNAGDAVLAERDGGARLVVRLADGLVAALAAATGEQLAAATASWAGTEELDGADLAVLGAFTGALARLCHGAVAGGGHVYCWLSV